MNVVLETPLKSDTPEGFQRNFRFLCWCARAVVERDKATPIASHGWCPWFLDDTDPDHRDRGINFPPAWHPDNPHWLFEDLGRSGGMTKAAERCRRDNLGVCTKKLKKYHPRAWEAFERGEWPGTPGFLLGPPTEAAEGAFRARAAEAIAKVERLSLDPLGRPDAKVADALDAVRVLLDLSA